MKMMLSAVALALTATSLPVAAQAPADALGKPDASRITAGLYKLDPQHSQVAFSAIHFGFSTYHGLFGDVRGTMTLDPANPSATKLAIDIPIANITTTSAALTAHLLKPEFFDATQFPNGHFESSAIGFDGNNATISGNLTLKGVTKPVTLRATLVGAGVNPFNKAPTIGFDASATIKRSDFGISYGLPFVTDEVKLDIAVAFEKIG